MKTRKFKITLFLITILLCLSNPGIVAAQTDDRVTVFLIDKQENPASSVTVNLILYRFNITGEQVTVETIPSGSCVTDQNGRCEIVVSANAPKDRSGFLKGTLDLGEHGKRSVTWPGGPLEVSLKLNPNGKLQSDTEAGPFDYDRPEEMKITSQRPPIYLVGIILGMAVLILAFYIYYRSYIKSKPR